jgi:hypothetical protein
MSTLANIRTKVRRLTGRPSPQQITDSQIDDYVNTFYLYDMPENLRLFTQETVFEFMTTKNVDQYNLNDITVWTGQQNKPASDVYITIKPPAFIAGYQSFWSQDREQFFRTYPALAELSTSIQGDGTTGPYTYTFANTPIFQNRVTVGAIDTTGATVNAIDSPTDRQNGTWQIINSSSTLTGSIDYLAGSVSVTFDNVITSDNYVNFSAVPYQPNRPQALLFYHNTITLRPVPDKEYLVQVNAYQRPTILVDSGDEPTLNQWWQYLAYGAAKKIFEDSQNLEGLQAIMPGYKEQEMLVLRRTIIERTNQRTATIYTEMVAFPYGNFNNRF